MKRLLALFVTVMLLCACLCCPIVAKATVTTYSGTVAILPGNPRSSAPVYSGAWLDNIIIRDDAMAVTEKEIIPRPTDYQSSHTYDEFIKEAAQYSTLFQLNEYTVASAYEELITNLYHVCAVMGMTDEMEPMRQYLIEYGISLDPNEDVADKAQIAVVYAALKYDAVYALYEKHVTIPKGSSVEGALVIILSALIGTETPGDVTTLPGYATFVITTYVKQFEDLPISEDPDASEVFHWAKVIMAAGNDHQVPIEVYTETSTAQKEYVDYAYYASIIETIYDVHVNPINLILATQSDDELALQKVILQSMLQQAEVDFSKDATCEELFKEACANGFFALENEFYCDIPCYDIIVAPSCEKIWFSPFSLAGQIEGTFEEYVTMSLQGQNILPGSTTAVALDPEKVVETITLDVYYNSPSVNEKTSYIFTVYKTGEDVKENVQSENNLLGEVEGFVNGIVPSGNETVDTIMDNVFSAVDNKLTTTTAPSTEGFLTTYAVEEKTTYALTTEATTTERFDFKYLQELIEGVYVTNENGEIVTTTAFTYENVTEEEEDSNIVQKAIEVVEENPEVVVAPTGLVTVGALVGYFMNKKHRDTDIPEEDTEE